MPSTVWFVYTVKNFNFSINCCTKEEIPLPKAFRFLFPQGKNQWRRNESFYR